MRSAVPGNGAVPGFAAQVLERKLDDWSQRIRSDVEPGVFLAEWLNLAIHTARADVAVVWLKTQDQRWTRIVLSLESVEGRPEKTVVEAAPEEVLRGLQSAAPVLLRGRRDEEPIVRGMSRVCQGGTPVGVLEAIWPGDFGDSANNTLIPFLGASAELLGDFLVQHELQHLRREQSRAGLWEQFRTTALAQPTLRELAQFLVHDGRSLTGSERIAAVQIQGHRCQVVAVSGVDVIDPRSTTVQVWEQLGAACLGIPKLSPTSELSDSDVRVDTACDRVRQATGAKSLVVHPLVSGSGTLFGLLVCEQFAEIADESQWKTDCQRLQRAAVAPWAALSEAELGWWAGRQRRWAQVWSRRRISMVSIVLVVSLLAVAAWVIPAPLKITAEGVLLPAERRDVFAGTSGIVTEVHVDHGTTIAAGELLAELRDPTADLEAARVAGDLATTEARLTVVQSARIAATTSTKDDTALAQQLAGEEAELQKQLESLLAQKQLLTAERAATRVTSPVAGEVLTWDVRAQLAGRPVQRGQVLLTVGDVAGPWIVEAQVRERDVPELRRAMEGNSDGVRASFAPTASTGKVMFGRVTEVARVTGVNDRGETTVRVIIAFDRPADERLRPGTTVLPRIDCGRHSLGYVWLREPWQTLRQQAWLWW